jgi:NTE family protein
VRLRNQIPDPGLIVPDNDRDNPIGHGCWIGDESGSSRITVREDNWYSVREMIAAPTHRLGIVLSGGGTRGLAHVGVLRALDEHGIRPDCIAGASAGAIVGALYAAGYSPPEMVDFFADKNPFRVRKLAFGKPGIIDADKVVSDFEETFPDNTFEALQKTLRIVATDMLRGEAVVFDSGPLIPAILASSAVPLVFTPVEVDGGWYADGGIVNNFPVELLEGLCHARIGVHVSPLKHIERSDLTRSVAIALRAFEVGAFARSSAKFDLCDVVINPAELADIGAFDTKRFDEVEQIGYDSAKASMEAIEAVLASSRETGEQA